MANITASMVKDLREKTGVGMMDCKTALTETNGDMEAAVDWLRKKGLSKAAKKAGRVAAEGLIGARTKGNKWDQFNFLRNQVLDNVTAVGVGRPSNIPPAKVQDMLKGLGRQEVESILAEQGAVVIRNEMCNHEYRFDAAAIARLFATH